MYALRFLTATAALVAACLLTGCGTQPRSVKAASSVKPDKERHPAPEFALKDADGKTVRLEEYKGKVVLLDFFATWCGPCKIETPWLVELQKEYGSQGLQVVGIAMDDSGKDDIEKFAKDMGVNYPVLLGKEAVGDAYGGVPALPESFFIGRNGKIVERIIGLKGRGEIEDAIKKALNTEPGAAPSSTASAALPAQN